MPKKRTPEDFLGRGWKYPLYTGDVNIFSGREKSIDESIIIILSTMKGERVMRPDFGCDIHKLVFENNDSSTHSLAETVVEEAIEQWEPRVTNLEVEAYASEEEPNVLMIEINYTPIDTNNSRNLVYPFYIQ